MLLQPVEADECPVCLDTLLNEQTILLTCRHLVCTPCVRSLWQLRRAESAATVHLECPVCRELVKVKDGDLAAFVAAHTASNFIGPVRTPRRWPPDDPQGLHTLTVAELKLLVAHFGLQARVSGQLERDDIERAIEAALPAPPLSAADTTSPIGRLPVKALRAVLELRAIPHDDCLERPELVERVAQSARGSCMMLPSALLRRMLAALGEPDAAATGLDKVELARRVMATRALRRAAAAAAAGATPRSPMGGQPPRTAVGGSPMPPYGGGAVLAERPEPPVKCGCGCTIA